MSTAKRVKMLINKIGKSQKDFANDLSISAARLNNYLSEVAKVPQDILIKISTLTGCDLTWLLTGEGDMFRPSLARVPNIDQMISIPVVADIAAGTGIEAEDLPPQQIIEVSQSCLSLPGPYWAFRVDGISMEPELHTGDIAIVTRDWYNIDYRNRICAFRLQEGLVIKRLLMPAKSKNSLPLTHQYCSSHHYL